MSTPLKFKISSALKDIIGQDLISDEYMAIFELVKNSFDAYSTKVDIHFENIYSNKGKITIKDNGKGMNFDDLLNKWLFVAYSAKREGTEDDNFDYRNHLNTNKRFAGAKGIGRFSCDKIGKHLLLETTKQEKGHKTEVLITDWEKFEGDLKNEFVDINLLHETINESKYGIDHGTILEITELRSEWSRDALLKLKRSLAKLINPNSGKSEQNFEIVIHVPEEEQNDIKYDEYYDKVNGNVQNFIFDTLGLKTTKIHVTISEDNHNIDTELYDGGTLVYKIRELNKFPLLDNIEFTIYYLNQAAKYTFTKRMGLSSKDYGHIFLYKNGFRIYPYGEPGEDPLKIDVRKAQGYNRFLGTRELIGQIEIYSKSSELKETSSRGDGLIKTKTYFQLEDCFWEVLKRLEKYVVDVQQWGVSIEDEPTDEINIRASDLISKLAGSTEILDFKYSEQLFDKINEAQSESASNLIENLKKIAFEKGNDQLLNEVSRVSNKLKTLQLIKAEIEVEKEKISIEKKEIEDKLELKEKENELLKEVSNDEIVELLSIEHHINQATFRVDGYIKGLYEIAKENKHIENPIIDIINNISLENKKIASLVKFVRRAGFDLLSSRITEDLVKYIEQYVRNVYRNDRVRRINKQLVKEVLVIADNDISFPIEFVPLEINIILDNLLDNSFKASASSVTIKMSVDKSALTIDYLDNGIGVDYKIKNSIFDFGVSTTFGSGIGLYHIRKIVDSLGGSVFLRETKHGANFIIEIPKKK